MNRYQTPQVPWHCDTDVVTQWVRPKGCSEHTLGTTPSHKIIEPRKALQKGPSGRLGYTDGARILRTSGVSKESSHNLASLRTGPQLQRVRARSSEQSSCKEALGGRPLNGARKDGQGIRRAEWTVEMQAEGAAAAEVGKGCHTGAG